MICFDLDGCLVDSSVAIPRTINAALAELGLPEQEPATLLRFIGPPLLASFRELLDAIDRDPDLAPIAVAAYRDAYPEVARAHTEVVPDISEVIVSLSHDRELRVVTSKPRRFAVPILQATGFAEAFAAVHAPALDELEEPKERTLAGALADAGTGGEHAVMVGDHPVDILAGRANGTATVGVTWGTGAPHELEDAGADHVVDEPGQLRVLLG